MKAGLSTGLVVWGMVVGCTLATQTFAEGNVAHGKKVFRKCQACHSIKGKNGVGPHLDGVVGRVAGATKDFQYSKSMTDAGTNGLVWNDKTLTAFLKNPKNFVKDTKMSFVGLRRKSETSNVIAYLQSLK